MPEEINRVVCDHLSDLLFAPNAVCLRNLRAEKIAREKIFLSGNTQFAAMRRVLEKTRGTKLPFTAPSEFVLVTVHRQENTTPAKLALLARLLASLDAPKLFVVHPRTAKVIKKNRLQGAFERAETAFLEPQGYAEILRLASEASAVVTDSGGLQKEAAALNKPVLIPRAATEWPDIVESGHACLVGLNAASGRAARRFLASFDSRSLKKIPEIAGNPAKKIVGVLLR
jgi:UDP-N-acetylglucosamine 2-epimerase (non-hydrolysing)